MSELRGTSGQASPLREAGTDRRWPADDIVDVETGGVNPEFSGVSVTEADAPSTETGDEEDVPLDVQFTDALSMLADGGHDYGARPLVPEDDLDAVIIDESSKDA
jgi:hypothetical protein